MNKRTRRGIALVVVLWTVAVLATVTAMASGAARSSASVATNTRALATARMMSESGVVAALALINDSLRVYANDSARRDNFLDRLEPIAVGAQPLVSDTLTDGVFAVTVVDVSARVDVNSTSAEGLARLFATVTDRATAERMGERIESIASGAALADDNNDLLRARDSLNAALLGRDRAPTLRRPFESLEAVREALGADTTALIAVAEELTVDGDGKINRRGASSRVRAAASGSLVDAPSRLLIIARGWQRGHPLTRQIEVVCDVAPDGLRVVRWRERDL